MRRNHSCIFCFEEPKYSLVTFCFHLVHVLTHVTSFQQLLSTTAHLTLSLTNSSKQVMCGISYSTIAPSEVFMNAIMLECFCCVQKMTHIAYRYICLKYKLYQLLRVHSLKAYRLGLKATKLQIFGPHGDL